MYVPPEVHLSHLYIYVGYATRSKYVIKGATLLLYYDGKTAKRGRIDNTNKTKRSPESIGSLGSTM